MAARLFRSLTGIRFSSITEEFSRMSVASTVASDGSDRDNK
jgi:hypothetical protein